MATSQNKCSDSASKFRFLIIYKVRKKIRQINPSINDYKIYSKRLCKNFRPIDEAVFEISCTQTLKTGFWEKRVQIFQSSKFKADASLQICL